MVGVDGNILSVAPQLVNLIRTTRVWAWLKKNCQYEVLINDLSLSMPTVWEKLNDLHQWWNIDDYEILCTAYHHETEVFLKA